MSSLDRLDPGSKRALQAAMVITGAESGEVKAMVGDRNPRFAGFNRALDARRHVGSLIKPAVFLTALEQPALLQSQHVDFRSTNLYQVGQRRSLGAAKL